MNLINLKCSILNFIIIDIVKEFLIRTFIIIEIIKRRKKNAFLYNKNIF